MSASGFDHAAHSRLVPSCAECHVLVDEREGRLGRPGANEHAPCDRCHKDKFFQPPGAFCRMCHVEVDPRLHTPKTAPAPMAPWPPAGGSRRYASEFSHRLHLDAEKMEKRLGFHATCRDCHLRQPGEAARDSGEPARDPGRDAPEARRAELSGHAGCAPCHGGQKDGKRPAITMADCRKCHVSESYTVPQGRRFITGDLTFSHARHEKKLKGAPIACAACHGAVADAPEVAHILLPAMVDCAKCHEDPARTPASARISNCSVCHKAISAGVSPRNHLGGATPDNHTIAFRTDHAEAARSPQARCRFCHGGLSSTTRDNCFECHLVMKPRDHTLRWATYDHGPEAAVNRQRCAQCHEVDYCARCHSQRPRSHTPFDTFVNGGHGTEARLNTRSCFACHTFDDTCARCHGGQAFPGGRPQ